MPLIEVHEVRSHGEIPTIDITFPNGMKDSMVLERFYPSEESKMARTPSCNFFGHLLSDKTACVSVTGCAGQDNMEFTINSVNSGPSNMYILHKNGDLEMVESAFKDERIRSEAVKVTREEGRFHLKDNDEIVNDAEMAELMKFKEMCASGDCKSMPSKQKMQIKIHYDDTFYSDTSDVTGYIDSMVTQLQAHMCQISLGTQIKIEAIDGYSYEVGESWKADTGTIYGSVYDITAASNSNADVHVFLCKDSAFGGTIGIAFVGTMCTLKYGSGSNAGINEKRQNVLATSEVVAHEMGHNMGMDHDFDESHGGPNGPCNKKGIMSYGSPPNVWSTCSRADFLALYNQILASTSWNWCLTKDNTACGGTAPPPGSTTTAAPPTECGSPQYNDDQWCDDDNNNAGCNYDGGACCNNNFSGWNTYCTDCDCLDPNATGPTSPTTTAAPPPEPTTASPPTTAAPPKGCGSPQYNDDQWCDDDNNNADCNYDGGACCDNNFSGWDVYCSDCDCLDPNATGTTCEDIWKAKKCQKMKKKGKCEKSNVETNCKKTCGIFSNCS